MAEPAVLLTRELVPEAMRALDGRCELNVYSGPPEAIPREELLRRANDKDGLLTVLTEQVDDEVLDAAGSRLRIVANHAVGFDNIDVPACTRRRVLVTNTPEVLTRRPLTWRGRSFWPPSAVWPRATGFSVPAGRGSGDRR